MANSSLLVEAKALCAAGIKTFVVAGKKPIYSGWQDRATTDFEALKKDILANPGCGLGMPTGEANGIDVWDIDGDEGKQSLSKWQDEGHRLPQTMGVLTGSGGYHFYFKHEPGLRNTAKSMQPGWDTRGDGGYVVIPPSIHPNTGKPYTWWDIETGKPRAFNKDDVTDWPEALLELYREGKKKANDELTKTLTLGGSIPTGIQEDTLTKMAGTMRRAGMSADEIEAALLVTAATRCDPPMKSKDAHRIAMSIGSRDLPTMVEQLVMHGYSDAANAQQFIQYTEGTLAVIPELKNFVRFDGTKWDIRDLGFGERTAQQFAKHVTSVLQTSQWPEDLQSPEARAHQALTHMSARLCSTTGLQKMVTYARYTNELNVSLETFDHPQRDAQAIYFPNGRLDLTLNELIPPSPEFKNTRTLPFEYDPEARAPQWLAFIAEALQSDEEMISYVQELCGIFLLGEAFKVLPIVHGVQNTGKSVFVKVLLLVMGDYADTIGQDVITASTRPPSPGSASPHLMKLRNLRLAVVSELAEKVRLDDALIKQITGGNYISARGLHQDQVTFRATHKLLIETNEEPDIPPTAGALWDRVHIIPFEHEVPEKDRITGLEFILAKDAAGVFNWAYEGLQRVMAKNFILTAPAKVRAATAQYREESNPLDDFYNDCVIFDPAFDARNPKVSIMVTSADELFAQYQTFCMARNEKYPYGKTKFGATLAADPRVYRSREWITDDGKRRTLYYGVKLRAFNNISNITAFGRIAQAD